MNKIYLGDVEIANVGSGGGSGDYVDTSTFAEQTHAAAAALVDLKQKHNELAKLEDALQDQEEALLAEVQAVEVAKADVSAVYMKSDIDNSDKVVAAALASLDDRVSTLETSSGGGGGGSFDPTDLSTAIEDLEDALLDVSTDIADIDASVANHESRITTLENSGGGGSFDPTDINSSISDISTRVSTIESDYVVANDISSFVTQTALDASYVALDASIQALDASALVFDASIKELAQGGGGGGSDSGFEKVGDGIVSYFSKPYVNNAGKNIVLGCVYSYNTSTNLKGEYNIINANGKIEHYDVKNNIINSPGFTVSNGLKNSILTGYTISVKGYVNYCNISGNSFTVGNNNS